MLGRDTTDFLTPAQFISRTWNHWASLDVFYRGTVPKLWENLCQGKWIDKMVYFRHPDAPRTIFGYPAYYPNILKALNIDVASPEACAMFIQVLQMTGFELVAIEARKTSGYGDGVRVVLPKMPYPVIHAEHYQFQTEDGLVHYPASALF